VLIKFLGQLQNDYHYQKPEQIIRTDTDISEEVNNLADREFEDLREDWLCHFLSKPEKLFNEILFTVNALQEELIHIIKDFFDQVEASFLSGNVVGHNFLLGIVNDLISFH